VNIASNRELYKVDWGRMGYYGTGLPVGSGTVDSEGEREVAHGFGLGIAIRQFSFQRS
jgi:hypothetical protein